MSSEELFDIRKSAEASRAARRKRLAKRWLPLGYVVILLSIFVGITRFTYVQNREHVVGLTHTLIGMLQQRITAQVEHYLSPAAELVELASGIFLSNRWDADAATLFEDLGLQYLAVYPQFDSFQVGVPDGRFLMTDRMPDGSIHTKIIQQVEGHRTVRWTRRNPDGGVIEIQEDPSDTYDPSNRPWYKGAAQTRSTYWTEVYLFHTSKAPGITAAFAVRDREDELLGVISIDIRLAGLSHFLSELNIGKGGSALIIDENGQVIAYPDLKELHRSKNGTLVPAMVDELGSPVLTRAFDHYRVEKYGIRHFSVADHHYSSMSASLKALVGRQWILLITVSQEDFVGFLSKNMRRGLFPSLIACVLVVGMAALLISQNLRAEHSARILADSNQMMESQSQAFAELTSLMSNGNGDEETLYMVGELVCQNLKIRRASLWRLADDEAHLICLDSFDAENQGHTRGTVLAREEFPHFFEALLSGEHIETTDVKSDPRTGNMAQAYFNPLGCSSLLAVPARRAQRVVGHVWFEHDGKERGWSSADQNLAHAIAGILAMRIKPAGGTESVSATPSKFEAGTSAFATGGVEPQDARACFVVPGGLNAPMPPADKLHTTAVKPGLPPGLDQSLTRRDLDRERPASAVVEGISVLVLQFANPVFLASPLGGGSRHSVMEDSICRIEQFAEAQQLEYIQVLGERIVLATGFDRQAKGSGQRIADAALEIQGYLLQLFSSREITTGFRMGIDMGNAFGNLVGSGQQLFNLWGDAVHTATRIAETGLDGDIQVAEAAYRCLRAEYLFRKRGSFYVSDLGEVQTYLLRGKL